MHRIRIEHFTKLRETQASNDEIVLELFITRESSKGMVDISDSRGYSFFKDKEINISYFEELKCELLNQNPTVVSKGI